MAVTRPLLLLTRPKAASDAFWAALPEPIRAAVDVMINPLLSIEVTGPLPSFDGINGLIFTSSNALHAFDALGGLPLKVPAIAVAEGTASALKAFGFQVDVAGGNADRLVHYVLDRGYPGPLLHLRGENAIGDIAQRLTEKGVPTYESVLYKQRLEPLEPAVKDALSQDRPVIAPVFSPRTAEQLGRESERISAIRFAAISQAVADALPVGSAARTQVAKTPNRDGMSELVAEMVRQSQACAPPE
ncbi:uroporphyrinogen-III synthase [Marivita sp. S2033]|uniref:uroporphyrinogen-III synthase n=1 Tax=Marivita sp. S2033 TaxID=3373187 RepID=UPI00398271EE